MNRRKLSQILLTLLFSLVACSCECTISNNDPSPKEGLPLFYWSEDPPPFVNFGDYISLKLVERIVGAPVRCYTRRTTNKEKKLLAIGSILYFANENDIIWGSGTNGKHPNRRDYSFSHLDVRAVRGPITRAFLKETFDIESPEIYGDPALLFPYFFPEFTRKQNPSNDYIIIPHYSELKLFPKANDPHIVYPTDPWNEIVEKILDSKLVIASALHGIIIAEAYGIPARLLRVTADVPLLRHQDSILKFQDYYLGTNRPNFKYAKTVEEALEMGGEDPFACDLKALYEAFPFEYWPSSCFSHPTLPSSEVFHAR